MLSTKLKDATVDKVKEERSDLYTEIYDSGTKAVNQDKDTKISTLETEVGSLKEQMRVNEEKGANATLIRDNAKKLGISEKGEALIAEGKPVQEALTLLIAEANKGKTDLKDAFAATAPPAAGNPASSELDLEEPKNQSDARDFCMKKYECTKKEAWRHAREDFPTLFGKDDTSTKENGGN